MDCSAHECPDHGDKRFDQEVADGVYVAVAAPAYKVNCNHHGTWRRRRPRLARRFAGTSATWSTRFGSRSRAGATLDQVKERLPAVLGPVYEKPFSAYGDYRPWRMGLLGNIERTYAMVS